MDQKKIAISPSLIHGISGLSMPAPPAVTLIDRIVSQGGAAGAFGFQENGEAPQHHSASSFRAFGRMEADRTARLPLEGMAREKCRPIRQQTPRGELTRKGH